VIAKLTYPDPVGLDLATAAAEVILSAAFMGSRVL
jgi:hypothetical protein